MDRSEYLKQLHSRYSVEQPDIISLVTDATGTSVANSTRIVRGDEYEVHRVQLHDDSSVYLRVTFPLTPTSKAEHEAWAMAQARENGAPVPEVLKVAIIDSPHGPRSAMVVRACPGKQLAEILATLRPEQRSTAMNNIGHLLALLHAIPMPGIGRPNADGSWPDPHTEAHRYLADCLNAADQLSLANFSSSEIAYVKDLLRPGPPTDDEPVLRHGDISAEHVFVDPDMNVIGLIDWGMWSAGPAAAELAGLAVTTSQPDYHAITTGYGRSEISESSIKWHATAQLVGQLHWLISSGQTDELQEPATALRTIRTRSTGAR